MADGLCVACHQERTGYKKQLCDDCTNPTKGWYRILALVSVLDFGKDNVMGRSDVLMRLREANPPNIARRLAYTKTLTFSDIRVIVSEARHFTMPKSGHVISIPIASWQGHGYFLVGSEDDLREVNEAIDRDIRQLQAKKELMRRAVENPSPLIQARMAKATVSR